MSTKQVHNYEGMHLVKKLYAVRGETDTAFAAFMSEEAGRPYSVAQVRSYRQALDIPNNAAPSRAPKTVYVVTDGGREPVAVYTSAEQAAEACGPEKSWSYHAFELL